MSQMVKLKSNVGDLYFPQNSSMARIVSEKSFHDLGVEFVMRYYAKELRTAYDAGANAGLFSILASMIANGSNAIVSFEPDTDNLACFEKNLELTKTGNVRIVPVAISDSDGVLEFGKVDCGLAKSSKTDIVIARCRALDSFIAESGLRPTFIKLDIEGLEIAALNGARELLSACDTVVEMEFSYRDHGKRMSTLTDIFSLASWDWEFQFNKWDLPQLLSSSFYRSGFCVRHLESGYTFWSFLATDGEGVSSILDTCSAITKLTPNRKWEITFTPKKTTRRMSESKVERFQIEPVALSA